MANGFGQTTNQGNLPTDEWLKQAFLRELQKRQMQLEQRQIGGHYNVNSVAPDGTAFGTRPVRSSIPTVATNGGMQPNIGGRTQDFITDAVPALQEFWKGAKRRIPFYPGSDPLTYLPQDLSHGIDALGGYGSGAVDWLQDTGGGALDWLQDTGAGAVDWLKEAGAGSGWFASALEDRQRALDANRPFGADGFTEMVVRVPVGDATSGTPSGAPSGATTFPMGDVEKLGAIVPFNDTVDTAYDVPVPAKEQIDEIGKGKSWQERLFGFGGGEPGMNMLMMGLRTLSNASQGQGFGQSVGDAYMAQTADARQLEAQSFARGMAKEQLDKSEAWEDKFSKRLAEVESEMYTIEDKNSSDYARLKNEHEFITKQLTQLYTTSQYPWMMGAGGGSSLGPGVDALLDAWVGRYTQSSNK